MTVHFGAIETIESTYLVALTQCCIGQLSGVDVVLLKGGISFFLGIELFELQGVTAEDRFMQVVGCIGVERKDVLTFESFLYEKLIELRCKVDTAVLLGNRCSGVL